MKLAIKRFFWVYLATYFLVGNLGISFTQSTCLFTGNKKYSFDKAVSCCSKNTKPNFNQANTSTFSRAKCCSYDQYALKFNFDQSDNKIQKLDKRISSRIKPQNKTTLDFSEMDKNKCPKWISTRLSFFLKIKNSKIQNILFPLHNW